MTKFRYQVALDAAEMLRANLFEGVMRVEVVGVLRRIASYIESGGTGDWMVGGIEILAIPNIGRVRHQRGSNAHNFLIERLEVLGYPTDWQNDYATFYAPLPDHTDWVAVKMWLTTMENFGMDYFIRTGTEEAVNRVCRPQSEGGWLKEGMRIDGGLWEGNQKIITLTESQFMQEAFGKQMIAPHLRAQMGVEK